MLKRSFLFLYFFLLQTITLHLVPPNPVIATIPVGLNPNGIAITPDGRFAYVANNNNNSIPNQDTVSVIDIATNTVLTTIYDASFNEPYTVTINHAGTIAYVTNSGGSTITRIDTATNTVLGTITGFDGPSGMVITPDDSTGYVNNYGATSGVGSGNGNTINVVNLTTNAITGGAIVINASPLPPAAPAALAITPNGAFVYIANYVDGNPGTGTVVILQTSTNTIVGPTIPGFSGPFDIVITPDGTHAYVTNFGSNNFAPVGTTVTVIDLTTSNVSATVPVGIQPSGIAVTPDGQYAYVTNYDTLYLTPNYGQITPFQGTVNIIRTSDNQVILPTINVGSSPAGIAITPDGQYAYVTNYSSNNVNVIGIPLFSVEAQGCKTYNVFLLEKELINKLTWTVSGESLPVYYSIYRDSLLTQLVATIPASQKLQFFDRTRTPGVTYTYYIVGVNALGITSYPVEVIVTQSC